MKTQVVLCADSESLSNPQIIGLDGENLRTQEWLRVFCSAIDARNYLKAAEQAKEVWVASSDDVDPINLAAALKKDSSEKGVYLLAFQGSGSLKSRANAAGLDGTLNQQDFIARYTKRKHEMAENGSGAAWATSPDPATSPVPPASSAPLLPAFRPQVQNLESQEAATEAGFEHLRAQAATKASPGKSAHILSVVSASGGAGKSTIAALSALFAQGLGHRTLLLDADLQFGDMRFFLGEEKPLTIDALINEPKLLNRLKPSGLKPALLAAPPHLEQSEALIGKLPGLLEALKAFFDVIVVNTGAFWSEQHAALLERSSTALFLVDQRSSSLRACKHALDLCVRCGIAVHPFLFAVNRCSRNAPLTSIDVSCALQGAHVIELPEGGRDVSELLAAGLPFELINTRNDLCIGIEKMLLELLPQSEAGEPEKESVLREAKRFRLSKKRRAACL
ncbi:MAG: chromosome partitioning protein ParA [Eggerthellaceae bacterium]|nr:chromosome partitioning protein ParA [Eggerthellaceae bacterium]